MSTDHTQQKLNLVSSRCLMALHAIIKSLASKRLSNDRKVFEELSQNLITMLNQFAFYYIQKCIVDKIGETSEMSDNTYTSFELQNHSFCLDQAILCVKILHKLVLHGFKDNIDNETLSHLIINLLQSFNQLITKYNRIINSTDSTVVDFFKEKYAYLIVLYVQVLTDYQDTYPFNFIQTGMSDCLSLIIQVLLYNIFYHIHYSIHYSFELIPKWRLFFLKVFVYAHNHNQLSQITWGSQ